MYTKLKISSGNSLHARGSIVHACEEGGGGGGEEISRASNEEPALHTTLSGLLYSIDYQ